MSTAAGETVATMSPVVEHSVILGELKELRRSGLVRLRSLSWLYVARIDKVPSMR